MSEYTIIKFKNMTPIHIGTGKENYYSSESDLQSDTLSSALAAIRAQMGQCEDIDKFLSSFRLSSAFPFYLNHYFFPKITGKINIKVKGLEENEYRKKLKKLKFIELGLWKKIIRGETILVEEKHINGEFLIQESFSETKIIHSQINQRVTIPRDNSHDTEPFFFDWKYTHQDAGLFCMTDAKGDLLNEIVNLFNLLGLTGLGTDKSIGGGKFDVETENIIIENSLNATHSMLLSLYIPTEEELQALDLNNSKFELLLRGGYIAGSQEEKFRHLRKKSIYMFNVGSVFPGNKALNGKVVNLQPQWNEKSMHPVYRSGKPLYISVKD